MEQAQINEEQARRRVVESAASDELSPAIIQDWSDARREYAEKLRELPIEEAHALLGAELQKVEAQLERLEEGVRSDREAALQNAVELGQRLRWALWLGDVLANELTIDPLSLLEQEYDRAGIRCRELTRLRPDDTEGAERMAEEIGEQRKRLLEIRLDRYGSDPGGASGETNLSEATTSWRIVLESYQLESRVLEQPGVDVSTKGTKFNLDELYSRRSEHLARSLSALEGFSSAELAQFAHVSITDLVDEASSTLSESRSLDPAERLDVLSTLQERADVLWALLSPYRARVTKKGEVGDEERVRARRDFRQLKRTRRQAAIAENETRARQRLEDFFGPRPVRLFERFITVLVFLFLGLIIAEFQFDPEVDFELLQRFHYVDLVFCAFFQLDFFVRWRFAGWNGGYFMRHFWLESLPALPYALIFSHIDHVQSVSAVRVASRWARLVRFSRVYRLLVFLSRGVDRLVERFRKVLDRDVVLFGSEPVSDSPESPLRRRTLTLEARRQRFMRNTYSAMLWQTRSDFLPIHVTTLGAETQVSGRLDLPYRRGITDVRGEVHLERVIQTFLTCDVARALSFLGREGAERMTRMLRIFDLPLIRRIPILRRILPEARKANPVEAITAVANALGEILQELLGALRFWADLSGITTGPQILDRVASAVITASKRPAVRLILFGSLLGVLAGLVHVLELETFEGPLDTVNRIFGLPLVILGMFCLVFLLIGFWLKRIAGEALGQYLRTADAQYYPLLKARKFLDLQRHIETLYRSVLKPECLLRHGEEIEEREWVSFLADPFERRARFMPRSNRPEHPEFAELTEERDLIALLYRDFLDGPVLHRSDDKTSGQLLGDLTIQEIRTQVLSLDGKSKRRLKRLDLDKGGALNLGPYFWFRFITESLAIETAKLIMEYNMACIPLDQRDFAPEDARARFDRFLQERQGDPTRRRRSRDAAKQRGFGGTLLTGSFTAFDFLGPSADSDREVERRYGSDVLACLEKDRRAVVRDVFGTRPYHLLPRNQRVFNPYLLYRKYVGGAKIFLLPLTIVYGFARLLATGIRQVMEIVREVLGKQKSTRRELSRIAGFDVAVRKINRMRKPFFIEALNLRAALDVEYLGLRLPGQPRQEDSVTFSEDLDYIGALETERKPVQELRNRAVRDLRAFRVFLTEHGWSDEQLDGVLDGIDASGTLRAHRGEVVRALVTAYITDHGELRSLITAPTRVREFSEGIVREGRPGVIRGGVQRFVCRLQSFSKRHKRRTALFDEVDERREGFRELSDDDRARLRREFLLGEDDIEKAWELALSVWKQEAEGDESTNPVHAALARVAKEYSLWTRRLITVRTVQTLTMLDIQSYRDMVREVGEYDDGIGDTAELTPQ